MDWKIACICIWKIVISEGFVGSLGEPLVPVIVNHMKAIMLAKCYVTTPTHIHTCDDNDDGSVNADDDYGLRRLSFNASRLSHAYV